MEINRDEGIRSVWQWMQGSDVVGVPLDETDLIGSHGHPRPDFAVGPDHPHIGRFCATQAEVDWPGFTTGMTSANCHLDTVDVVSQPDFDPCSNGIRVGGVLMEDYSKPVAGRPDIAPHAYGLLPLHDHDVEQAIEIEI